MTNRAGQLPRSLGAWTALGDLFDDALTETIASLVLRLGAGLGLERSRARQLGEPDGYHGIDRRGPISRLVMTELALAQELPEEFLRRVTQGEAGYYDLAFAHQERCERMLVLFDAGPEQLGAARVGQLAAILLLWRQAELTGVPLELAPLHDPHAALRGELKELVIGWLESRTHETASDEPVASFLARTGTHDECWICCGPATAARLQLPPDAGTVTFAEAHDGDSGATHLIARHAARQMLLELPDRRDVVRLLRGRGFRREGSPTAQPSTQLHHPSFPGGAARLLCRTDDPNVLSSIAVPGAGHTDRPRAKKRTFTGPVIAAAYIGARTVAVTCDDDQLTVEVIGKRLANLDGLTIPLEKVDLRENELDQSGRQALRTMVFSDGDLYVDLPSGWWQINRTGPTRHPILAAAPRTAADRPVIVRAFNDAIWVDRYRPHIAPDALLVIGGGHLGSGDRDSWTLTDLRSGGQVTTTVDRPPDGIVTTNGEPFFVVRSNAGQIVRLVGRKTRTITQLSGDITDIAVHPVLPLIAVQRQDGSIVVHDAHADAIVLRMAATTA